MRATHSQRSRSGAPGARGHEVAIETWTKWQPHVEAEGMRFYPAPEYQVFPTRERPLKPYEAVVRAVGETAPAIRDFRPDVAVNDVLTLAPALAAELEAVPLATLVPHFYPPTAAGVPPYGLGAMAARTALGRSLWRATARPMSRGVERGRRELNETRRRVGLLRSSASTAASATSSAWSATFPQLEYPRVWPAGVHVTGPLIWQPPGGESEWGAPGTGRASWSHRAPRRTRRRPCCAPHSRARRPTGERAAAPPRGHDGPAAPPPTRGSSSGSATRRRCRARTWWSATPVTARSHRAGRGAPVVTVPAAGDMAENGARAQWAGAASTCPGASCPRRRCAGWSSGHSSGQGYEPARENSRVGPARMTVRRTAAKLVERFAGGARS